MLRACSRTWSADSVLLLSSLPPPPSTRFCFNSSNLALKLLLQSDPDLPGLDIPEPRFTGRINFPRYRRLTVSHPDIPGTPIYRAKSFPPRIPVNRGPTVYVIYCMKQLYL
eukprot:sb/3477110/